VTRVPGRSELWAVGQSSTTSTTTTLIEHYDGMTWRVVSSPNLGISSALYSVSADSGYDVWAVGSHSGEKEAPQSLSMRYDGSQWSILATSNVGGPTYSNPLYGVDALSPTDVWAVGTSMAPDGNAAYAHIEHYDGTHWDLQTAANPGLSVLYGIAASSPTDIWAVGYYQHVDADRNHTLLEHFDGHDWAAVPTPFIDKANASYTGIALMPGSPEILAVGTTNDALGQEPATYSRPLIESLTLNCRTG
jgi:hypothetical protein